MIKHRKMKDLTLCLANEKVLYYTKPMLENKK